MLLKVGSKGEDVKKLQAKLGLGADGIFGKGTEEAVKAFQLKDCLIYYDFGLKTANASGYSTSKASSFFGS